MTDLENGIYSLSLQFTIFSLFFLGSLNTFFSIKSKETWMLCFSIHKVSDALEAGEVA